MSLLFSLLSLYITWVLLPIGTIGHFIPSEDPYGFPKYAIRYVSSPEWDTLINDYNEAGPSHGRIYSLSKDMKCFIPAEKRPSLSEQMEEEPETSSILSDTLERGVDMISQTLDDRCVYYNNGFWIYQYCAGEGIIQAHNVSGDPQKLFYLLGRSGPTLEEREFRLLYNGNGYYISEFLSGGDICDVTGMERVAEVQYVCGEMSGIPSIRWVREVRTCQYEFQVGIPELCDLQLLVRNEGRDNATTISCFKDEGRSSDSSSNKDSQISSLREMNERTILDWLGEYDPLFLGFGVYLMQPIDKSQGKDFLIYSDEVDRKSSRDMLPSILYRKIGTSLSRLMHQRIIKGPEGSVVVPGDSFTWVSDVYGLDGGYISTVSLNITKEGEAFLVISDDITFNEENSNFNSFEKARLPVKDESADQTLAAMLMKGIEMLGDPQFLEKLAENPRLADLEEGEREYILEHVVGTEEFKKALEALGLNSDDDINFSDIYMELEHPDSDLDLSELDNEQARQRWRPRGQVDIEAEVRSQETDNQMENTELEYEYDEDSEEQELLESEESRRVESGLYDTQEYINTNEQGATDENEEVNKQTETIDDEEPSFDTTVENPVGEPTEEGSTITTEFSPHIHDEL